MKGKIQVECGVIVAVLSCAAIAAKADPDLVKASSFGWNETNATECLRAALASGAKTVLIDRQAGEWLTEPLNLCSDQEVVLEDGVTVRALPGAFKGLNDTLMCIAGVTNVILRGEGSAKLVMNKPDYQDPTRYKFSEWRFATSIGRYAKNVTIRDLEIRSSGGDGVFVYRCSDVLLENLNCVDHHRQGISVSDVDGLTVRNCQFNDTKGTAPQFGVDIEPHNPSVLKNILFEGCEFHGNAFGGISVSLGEARPDLPPVSITFRNCRVWNNSSYGLSFDLSSASKPVYRGDIFFDKCQFVTPKGQTVRIAQHPDNGCRIGFRDCVFDRRGNPDKHPVFNFDNSGTLADFAHVRFKGVKVLMDGGEVMAFNGMTGCGMSDVAGMINVVASDKEFIFDVGTFAAKHVSDPAARSFTVCDVAQNDLMPICPKSVPVSRECVATPRSRHTFLQYVPAAGEYKLRFEPKRYSPKEPLEMKIEVADPAGTVYDHFEVREEEGREYVLKAVGSGTFAFRIAPGFHALRILSEYPGQGYLANTRLVTFCSGGSKFYFRVPAGTQTVSAEIVPYWGSSAEAMLIAPDGTVGAVMKYGKGGCLLSAKRTHPESEEVWQLALGAVADTCSIRIGAPSVPVLARDPGLVLAIEKGNSK